MEDQVNRSTIEGTPGAHDSNPVLSAHLIDPLLQQHLEVGNDAGKFEGEEGKDIDATMDGANDADEGYQEHDENDEELPFGSATTWRDIGTTIIPDLFGTSNTSRHGKHGSRKGAPRYSIPPRKIGAVEVPMLIQNVDRAVKAFDGVRDKSALLDHTHHTIPFYLNPESPWRQPIMSHGAKTHNVVLKITVPKRTGRRRKRGTQGPWEEVANTDATATAETIQTAGDSSAETTAPTHTVHSRSRLDDPRILRRKLEDNVGKYQAEAVGMIDTTHRFRRLTDFYWNLESSPFVQKFMSTVYTNDVSKMREFSFTPGTDRGPNVDIIPPPTFANMSLPFNYAYSQNPYVHNVGEDDTVNITLPHLISTLIAADEPAPEGPKADPDMRLPRTVEIIAELEEAFDERPIWTRRALLNRIGRVLPTWNEARKYTSFVSYQFKGGPWRDAMVKYGVDPRTDPKYRIYQTLMFQIARDYRQQPREDTWREMRKGRDAVPREFTEDMVNSHIFDGREYYTDGKVWQVCDITDPLLSKVFAGADVRPELSPLTGWYHGGLWAKVKAIMKTKLLAIMFDRQVRDIDFARCLSTGNMTPPKGAMLLQIPNLRLTDEEWFGMTGKRGGTRRRHRVSATQRSAPVAASRKALEYFAAGGGLPLEIGQTGKGIFGPAADDDDDGSQFGHEMDPSLGDVDGDVSMDGGYYGDYDQVEEEVHVGYDEADFHEDEFDSEGNEEEEEDIAAGDGVENADPEDEDYEEQGRPDDEAFYRANYQPRKV